MVKCSVCEEELEEGINSRLYMGKVYCEECFKDLHEWNRF